LEGPFEQKEALKKGRNRLRTLPDLRHTPCIRLGPSSLHRKNQ